MPPGSGAGGSVGHRGRSDGGYPFGRTVAVTGVASALVALPYVVLGSLATDAGLFFLAFGGSLALSGSVWARGRRLSRGEGPR